MPRAKHVASPVESASFSGWSKTAKADRCVRQRIMKVAKAVAPWPPQAIFSRTQVRLAGRSGKVRAAWYLG